MKTIKSGISVFKKITCPTCNSHCGLVVEVKNNVVISVRPDKEHPLSKGYCCPKGSSLGEITNDEDRVLRPLKRIGDEFQTISWKRALHEIAAKLTKIRNENGPNSIAYYMGTNSLHQYAHGMFVTGFMSAIGSANIYNAGSVDNNNKFVAQHFLYGSSIIMPIPDLPNTELFIIFGSNPVVTRLSLVNCPNVGRVLEELRARGGEIYVIDPRRNETARKFADDDHYIPIFPNTDVFLLLSMINVIFSKNLEDNNFLRAHATGHGELKKLVESFTPEMVEKICKVPAERIYDLTKKFVETEKAVIYARLGTCLSTFCTLNAWAVEVLNMISGHLDRPGGAIFGKNLINVARMGGFLGLGSFNKRRSRIGKYPDVMGAFPLGILAREILAPRNPVKALLISGGNPYLSAPNSNEFHEALKKLELCIVLDFYINETANFAADYILPVRTPLENANVDAFSLNYQVFSHMEYSHAVVTPAKNGPKPEWEILLSLMRLMKLKAFDNTLLNAIPKLFSFIHEKFNPDIILRILFFLGQVFEKKFPHLSSNAIAFNDLKKKELILLGRNEYGVVQKYLQTKNKKINLLNPQIKEQIELCRKDLEKRVNELKIHKNSENDFVLIGRRSLKTMNSWMHNVKNLWRTKQIPKLLINTQDANRLKIIQDEIVTLKNQLGSITVPIEITDDIMPGVVCYPHGWGHHNLRLSFANQHPGENINVLTDSHELEKLSGMPLMNGYKVKLLKIKNSPK